MAALAGITTGMGIGLHRLALAGAMADHRVATGGRTRRADRLERAQVVGMCDRRAVAGHRVVVVHRAAVGGAENCRWCG